MRITYRDDLGIVVMEANEYGIDFDGQYAYIGDDDGNETKIEIGNIISIRNK